MRSAVIFPPGWQASAVKCCFNCGQKCTNADSKAIGLQKWFPDYVHRLGTIKGARRLSRNGGKRTASFSGKTPESAAAMIAAGKAVSPYHPQFQS